jgi:uncharacterized protein (TIGR03067 family)
MRVLVLMLCVTSVAVAQAPALKDLTGAYTVKEFERDGTAVPEKTKESITAFTIKDGQLSITMDKTELTATLKVDTAKKPAEMDLFPLNADFDKGRKFPGLYKWEKDTLTIHYVEDGERPKDFTGGKGSTKLVLVKK